MASAGDRDVEMQLLVAKKQSFITLIEKLYRSSKAATSSNADSSTQMLFLAKANNLDTIITQFMDVVDKINALGLQQEDYIPDFTAVENFLEQVGLIQLMVAKLNQVRKDAADRVKPPVQNLPMLQLPSFSGENLYEWEVFYHSFNSMIHDNRNLSNDQKVQYLVSKLSGKALSVCSGVPCIGTNYQQIYNALKERYMDKRLLASYYIDQILSFKNIKGESVTQLNSFIDKVGAAINGLKNLNLPDLSGFMLGYMASNKLDSETAKLFQMSIETDKIPTHEELLSFVKNHVKVLSHLDGNKESVVSKSNSKSKVTQSFLLNDGSNNSGSSANKSCILCEDESHPLYKCDKFLKLTINERNNVVKKNNLCFSCFSTKHRLDKCASKHKCFKCKGRHNTLLHNEKINSPADTDKIQIDKNRHNNNHHSSKVDVENQSSGSKPVTHAMCSTEQKTSSVFLSTVKVKALDAKGNSHFLRLLLDTGSESNFLCENIVKRLGLQVTKVPSSVHGIAGTTSPVKGKVDFNFMSRFDDKIKFAIKALVLTKISDNLPTRPVSEDEFSHLKNVLLSDDEFNVSKPVHGILGAAMFSVLLEPGKISGPVHGPIAINTMLGYTVLGGNGDGDKSYFCGLLSNPLEDTLESRVQKFLDLEEVPTTNPCKPDDKNCEEIFINSYYRDSNGKFIVSLPFKQNPDVLGESYHIAKKRYFNLEKKLSSNESLRLQYNDVMSDFLKNNYMSKVIDDSDHSGYYIPQHLVVREDHASFKVRPVFDASANSASGLSLNDILYTGPKLYNDLFNILLSFRLFKIAITTDIKKMYLQIGMNESDRKYQKIFFRFSPEEPLDTYTLDTVTFGIGSSPYLALRCIRELTSQESENYPLACLRVQEDSYMDDICSSVATEEEALELQTQLVSLFNCAGFQLSKWGSNSTRVLNNIHDEDKLDTCLKWDESSFKVLGLSWHPVKDNFIFTVNVKERECTKRNILSLTASIFDVLGLLAPVTLYAKLLIKLLWQEKIDWDTVPPKEIVDMWSTFQSELPLLSGMSFDRHIGATSEQPLTLIGFGDASEKAYACVIYGRVESTQGEVTVSLICSKSKVSPLKSVSIPRLELCAALLLSKMMKVVINTYSSRVKIDQYFCLSDSKVTVDWIKSDHTHRFKQFVSNRVTKIHEYVGKECFHHISGVENVSDCASRGLTPSQFLEYPVWRTGPEWLRHPVSSWPLDLDTTDVSDEINREEKKNVFVIKEVEPSLLVQLASRHSSWLKLLHVIVFVLRFLKILPRRDNRLILNITSSDLQEAERRLLIAVQTECFSNEINNIKNNKICTPAIQKLNPFIQNELVIVGGRLTKSTDLGFEQKHPVLLPGKHHVTNLIIDYTHNINLHTGPHLLLSLLRQKYWIMGGRNIVRQRVRQCNHCFKFKPESTNPLMGDLPSTRISESKVFAHTGVDYTGSVNITMGKKRGVVSQKAYICLFVCLSTKAIHLELATDLSTDAFLSAFKRFIARRGSVSVMYSDGGKNFLGAKNKLDDLYKFLESKHYNESLSREFQVRNIKWKFIPPLSPHMGGLWESNIKMVKQHLLKVIGLQILTYEEMYTVLTQIEALLNSRPLCPLSSDPNDVQVLTPAHFLHAVPLQFIPAEDVLSSPTSRLNRYQLLDQLVQSYWRRWKTEYLHNLQTRNKWTTPQKSIQVGDVVIIKDDLVTPLMWNLGVITQTFPGSDGVVRIVNVKTKTGSYKRPVVKICPLPTQ